MIRIDKAAISEDIAKTLEIMEADPDQLPRRLVEEFMDMKMAIEAQVRMSGLNGTRAYLEMKITPGGALYLLSINTDNREIKTSKVTQWLREMRAKRWVLNGVGIVVADTCELNDGQHRLIALWLLRDECWADRGHEEVLVAIGVTRESRFTLDNGAVRSAGDNLGLRGVANPGAAASIARNVIGFDIGNKTSLGRKADISSGEIQDRVTADHLLRKSANWAYASKAGLTGIAGVSIAGTAYYLLSQIDPLEADRFLTGIRDGAEPTDIRMIAREALRKLKASATSPTRLEIILRAWNTWKRGTGAQNFKSIGELPFIDGFPYPAGQAPVAPKGGVVARAAAQTDDDDQEDATP